MCITECVMSIGNGHYWPCDSTYKEMQSNTTTAIVTQQICEITLWNGNRCCDWDPGLMQNDLIQCVVGRDRAQSQREQSCKQCSWWSEFGNLVWNFDCLMMAPMDRISHPNGSPNWIIGLIPISHNEMKGEITKLFVFWHWWEQSLLSYIWAFHWVESVFCSDDNLFPLLVSSERT